MIEETPPAYAYPSGAPSTASKSAVSWAAIFAGALVATSVTLVLFALGSGMGFASVSPWPGRGVSGVTVAAMAAIWMIATQWISAGIGGYLAGRLRTRWIGTHTHEVFFRDTAHGLTTWALTSLLMAGALTSTVGSSISALGRTAGGAASMAARGAGGMAASSMPDSGYDIDVLLRPSDASANGSNGADPKTEVTHIIANSVATGSVPDSDRAYLSQLVAARTGVDQQTAQKRVDDFIASVNAAEVKAKAGADAARKASAEAAIYMALSLLVGAFIASITAVLGGRRRDEHP